MQNYKSKFQKRYNKRKEINSQWNTILQLIDECEQSKAQLKSVDTNKLEKCMSLLCNQQYPIKTVSNEVFFFSYSFFYVYISIVIESFIFKVIINHQRL